LSKNFEFSHNLKWYIIRISFERVLRNIQKNLLLKGYAPTSFPGKITENEVGYAYLLQVSLQFWNNYKIAPEEKWVWGEVRTPWLSLWMLTAKLRSRSQVVLIGQSLFSALKYYNRKVCTEVDFNGWKDQDNMCQSPTDNNLFLIETIMILL
jgi:hypothetical protein